MASVIRGIVGVVLALALLVPLGCAPAAAPTPTAAPAKPAQTAAPADKAPDSSPAAKPPATPVSQAPASKEAKPAPAADWKQEWDKTVAAAKKEGKVVIAGGPGDLYRKAVMAFQKAYPDIQVEYTGVQGAEFGPRIVSEREAGLFLWDVHFGGSTTIITMLKPKGFFDPLKPALMLPEVLDDSKWLGGFDEGFVDKEHQYVLQFDGRLTFFGYVNRDTVPESELSTVDQLLDPKWKGKIATLDPRAGGSAGSYNGYLLAVKGEDWLRKLLAQDPVILKDSRMLMEGLVRGRYAVGQGVNAADIEQFRQEGLGGAIKPLEPAGEAGRRLTGGFGNLTLVSKSPHPNAAKVFANWLLSQEGQKVWAETLNLNSRRLDVNGPPETAPDPKVKYLNVNHEEMMQYTERAISIAKELLK